MGVWAKNAESIEAGAAVVTAVIAIAALIGAKIQLDHSDFIQREQSARDAYRAHLALSVSNPDFAKPINVCTLVNSAQGGAYQAFVDHLLYSAEQMLAVEDGWSSTFLEQLAPHTDYLCSAFAPETPNDEVDNLMMRFKAQSCSVEPKCS